MIPKGDIPGVCKDCGEHITYFKKPMQTHAELLKNIDAQSVGILH